MRAIAADFVIGSLIILIITFSIVFIFPSAEAVTSNKVVLLNGKLVDLSEFKITPASLPECSCIHLHPASGSSVTARDGTIIFDPSPDGCGFGCISAFKQGIAGNLPSDVDRDHDGVLDTDEVAIGTNPDNPCTDGKTLDGDTDGDGDGLTVNEEKELGLDITKKDSNDNGIPDGLEVALSKTAKDFYKIPLLINILKDSPADKNKMKKFVEDMNIVWMQARIMFHLVEVLDLPDNDGEPGGANNNGDVESQTEDTSIRDDGKSEIKSKIQNLKKLKGKGMKMTFVKDITWPGDAGGTAIAGNSVVLVREFNPAETVLVGVHELMHALGLVNDDKKKHGHTEETPEADDNGPENPLSTHKHGYDFVNSNKKGEGVKGMKMTQTQITRMQDLAKQFGIPGTGNSPYFVKNWQGGAAVDTRGDQTGGNPDYLDIISINMESADSNDLVSILLTIGGLYPSSGPVDATYSLLFDTDDDQLTGFEIGSFFGIEQELVIQVTGDASIEPLSVTGTIWDNVSFFDTLLIPRPQILERSAQQIVPPVISNPLAIPVHIQISFDVSKTELGFTATDIPVGVMTRDEPDSFSPPFNEIDTAFLTFDGDTYLDFPTLELFTQSATEGDSVAYSIFGLTPSTDFNLELDHTVIDSGTTDVNGDFSSSFTFPDVEPVMHFLTAIDDAEEFTFNRIDAIEPKQMVGGTIIPLDTTMVLLAGTQMTASWMIPVIFAGIGIAIVITRKF